MGASKSIFVVIVSAAILSACSSGEGAGTDSAQANNSPNMPSPPPVIFLTDNLDEKDKFGWCVDTKGRGFAEQLHVHSCKPTGEDVLFSYDAVSGQIRSATYANKCAQLVGEDAKAPFGLLDCNVDNPAQRFNYTVETSEFHPRGQKDQCIVVGENTRPAGPFLARDLLVAPCKDIESSLKRWTILPDG